MWRSKATILGGIVAIGLLSAACGGGDGDDSTAEPTETAEPSATQPADGGNGGDSGVLFDGKPVQEFYTLNCSACHGANREGITGLGLPLLPDKLTQDDEFYRDTITNGRPNTVMPAWGAAGLSADEIDALIAFIRTEP